MNPLESPIFSFFDPSYFLFLALLFDKVGEFPEEEPHFHLLDHERQKLMVEDLFHCSFDAQVQVRLRAQFIYNFWIIVRVNLGFSWRRRRSRSIRDIRWHIICISKYLGIQRLNARCSESAVIFSGVVARGRAVARILGMS